MPPKEKRNIAASGVTEDAHQELMDGTVKRLVAVNSAKVGEECEYLRQEGPHRVLDYARARLHVLKGVAEDLTEVVDPPVDVSESMTVTMSEAREKARDMDMATLNAIRHGYVKRDEYQSSLDMISDILHPGNESGYRPPPIAEESTERVVERAREAAKHAYLNSAMSKFRKAVQAVGGTGKTPKDIVLSARDRRGPILDAYKRFMSEELMKAEEDFKREKPCLSKVALREQERRLEIQLLVESAADMKTLHKLIWELSDSLGSSETRLFRANTYISSLKHRLAHDKEAHEVFDDNDTVDSLKAKIQSMEQERAWMNEKLMLIEMKAQFVPGGSTRGGGTSGTGQPDNSRYMAKLEDEVNKLRQARLTAKLSMKKLKEANVRLREKLSAFEEQAMFANDIISKMHDDMRIRSHVQPLNFNSNTGGVMSGDAPSPAAVRRAGRQQQANQPKPMAEDLEKKITVRRQYVAKTSVMLRIGIDRLRQDKSKFVADIMDQGGVLVMPDTTKEAIGAMLSLCHDAVGVMVQDLFVSVVEDVGLFLDSELSNRWVTKEDPIVFALAKQLSTPNLPALYNAASEVLRQNWHQMAKALSSGTRMVAELFRRHEGELAKHQKREGELHKTIRALQQQIAEEEDEHRSTLLEMEASRKKSFVDADDLAQTLRAKLSTFRISPGAGPNDSDSQPTPGTGDLDAETLDHDPHAQLATISKRLDQAAASMARWEQTAQQQRTQIMELQTLDKTNQLAKAELKRQVENLEDEVEEKELIVKEMAATVTELKEEKLDLKQRLEKFVDTGSPRSPRRRKFVSESPKTEDARVAPDGEEDGVLDVPATASVALSSREKSPLPAPELTPRVLAIVTTDAAIQCEMLLTVPVTPSNDSFGSPSGVKGKKGGKAVTPNKATAKAASPKGFDSIVQRHNVDVQCDIWTFGGNAKDTKGPRAKGTPGKGRGRGTPNSSDPSGFGIGSPSSAGTLTPATGVLHTPADSPLAQPHPQPAQRFFDTSDTQTDAPPTTTTVSVGHDHAATATMMSQTDFPPVVVEREPPPHEDKETTTESCFSVNCATDPKTPCGEDMNLQTDLTLGNMSAPQLPGDGAGASRGSIVFSPLDVASPLVSNGSITNASMASLLVAPKAVVDAAAQTDAPPSSQSIATSPMGDSAIVVPPHHANTRPNSDAAAATTAAATGGARVASGGGGERTPSSATALSDRRSSSTSSLRPATAHVVATPTTDPSLSAAGQNQRTMSAASTRPPLVRPSSSFVSSRRSSGVALSVSESIQRQHEVDEAETVSAVATPLEQESVDGESFSGSRPSSAMLLVPGVAGGAKHTAATGASVLSGPSTPAKGVAAAGTPLTAGTGTPALSGQQDALSTSSIADAQNLPPALGGSFPGLGLQSSGEQGNLSFANSTTIATPTTHGLLPKSPGVSHVTPHFPVREGKTAGGRLGVGPLQVRPTSPGDPAAASGSGNPFSIQGMSLSPRGRAITPRQGMGALPGIKGSRDAEAQTDDLLLPGPGSLGSWYSGTGEFARSKSVNDVAAERQSIVDTMFVASKRVTEDAEAAAALNASYKDSTLGSDGSTPHIRAVRAPTLSNIPVGPTRTPSRVKKVVVAGGVDPLPLHVDGTEADGEAMLGDAGAPHDSFRVGGGGALVPPPGTVQHTLRLHRTPLTELPRQWPQHAAHDEPDINYQRAFWYLALNTLHLHRTLFELFVEVKNLFRAPLALEEPAGLAHFLSLFNSDDAPPLSADDRQKVGQFALRSTVHDEHLSAQLRQFIRERTELTYKLDRKARSTVSDFVRVNVAQMEASAEVQPGSDVQLLDPATMREMMSHNRTLQRAKLSNLRHTVLDRPKREKATASRQYDSELKKVLSANLSPPPPRRAMTPSAGLPPPVPRAASSGPASRGAGERPSARLLIHDPRHQSQRRDTPDLRPVTAGYATKQSAGPTPLPNSGPSGAGGSAIKVPPLSR